MFRQFLHKIRQKRWERATCGLKTTEMGLKYHLRNYDDWLIFHEIFELGEYDEPLRELSRRFSQSDVKCHVLDLGANVGLFGLRLFEYWLKEKLPLSRLHLQSIEPDRQNCAAIEGLIQRNPELGLCWRVDRGLVGEVSGQGALTKGPGHFAHSVDERSDAQGEKVDYLDLHQIIKDWPSVNLLKVDIEGSETSLLRNFPEVLKASSVVCLETHGAHRHEVVLQHLTESGFPNPSVRILSGEGPDVLSSVWVAR